MPVTPYQAEAYNEAGLWTTERIGDLVSRQAARTPDRELFAFENTRVTYREFDAWVHRVASDMVVHGVGPGDRVLVALPNCLECLVLQAAAFRIGAVNVPVITINREHENRQILRDVRPNVIAVAAELGARRPHVEIDTLLAEMNHTPRLKYVVGEPASNWAAVPGLKGHDGPVSALPDSAPADRPALILYTSGTTSAPKGAYLSSHALIAQLRNMAAVAELDESSVVAAGTPVAHVGGLIAGLLLPAYLGARSVILPAWNPDKAIDVIERERVTVMMGATVFIQDLVERYSSGAGQTHRLERYMCAGAAIPASLVAAADAVGVFTTRNYGMTETAGICTGAIPADPTPLRHQWDGRLLAGMEIEAVDQDRTRLLDGQEGELRVRGPQLFDGYTDTAITQAQFDADGWFYSGDVGIVNDGWVKMTGRTKDIINRGGEKFSTQDIEHALLSHEDVVAAAVTAVPDPRFGEAVGAWIVLTDSARWRGPRRYLEHLDQQRLAKAKLPVEWHVVEAIPTSASGKIQKFRLKDLPDLATAKHARLTSTSP
jgi:acyl-CoA synthetase (AMP-forming)/AMP-acid ligase II